MSNIKRGESVISTPIERQISMAEICAKFKIDPGATATLVTADVGVVSLAKDDVVIAQWVETKVAKARKKKAQVAA